MKMRLKMKKRSHIYVQQNVDLGLDMNKNIYLT